MIANVMKEFLGMVNVMIGVITNSAIMIWVIAFPLNYVILNVKMKCLVIEFAIQSVIQIIAIGTRVTVKIQIYQLIHKAIHQVAPIWKTHVSVMHTE